MIDDELIEWEEYIQCISMTKLREKLIDLAHIGGEER